MSHHLTRSVNYLCKIVIILFITNFPMTARLTRQMKSALPKLAKPHFYINYYRTIIYLLSNAVYIVNIGRACLHAALGELSSHAKRELLMEGCYNPF